MDKETLSNYGWIVICVLVLACMLALATPFGNFVAEGFKATYVSFWQGGNNAIGGIGSVIETPPPSAEQLQSIHTFDYYSSVALAVSDVSADTIGENADCDKKDAVAGIYIDEKGIPNVVVLKDNYEANRSTVKKDMVLYLAGHKLSYDDSSSGVAFDIIAAKLTIDGRKNGSQIDVNTTTNVSKVVQARSGGIEVNGGKYTSTCQSNSAAVIQTAAQTTVKDVDFYAYSASAAPVFGITLQANQELYVKDSKIVALNTSGTRASGIVTKGKSTLINCEIYSIHSAVQILNETYIDGGKYVGYAHGGLYISSVGANTYVKNAIIMHGDAPDGYTGSSFKTGLYVGGDVGFDNISAYIHNCKIISESYPMVLRSTDGEKNNSIYVSDTKISTDTKIRIDNDTHRLYIGKGCNFGRNDTNRPSSDVVIETNESYSW